MATKISIDLDAQNLIDGIDKSAAKIEDFSTRADKAIGNVDESISGMSQTQQRAYSAIKKSYENHQKELEKIGSRYEELRRKQQSNVDLTKSEQAELQALSKQYKDHSGAISTCTKQLESFSKNTQGLGATLKGAKLSDVLSTFTGTLGALTATKFAEWAKDAAAAVASLGLDAQKMSSQFGAMAGNLQAGEQIYQLFADTARNTNYDQSSIMTMGKDLLNLGYSAQDAADLITQCSNAAAKLGMNAGGAQNLVDFISKIQSSGKLTVEQLAQLQSLGLDLGQVFSNMGLTASEAINGLKTGTIDSQEAVKALTDYMKSFDGAMDESKNNIVDQWGDIVGNLTECCAQIGKSIADAFKQSDILTELIKFTQVLVDIIQGQGCGAFTALGKLVSGVFDVIGTAVKAVIQGVELLILVANKLGEGFMTIGKAIYDKLSWLLDPLAKLYDVVKNILTALGQEIDAEFKSTYTPAATSGSETALTTPVRAQTIAISSYTNTEKVKEETKAVLDSVDAYQELALVQSEVATASKKVSDATAENIDWAKELTSAFSSFGSDILKNGINFMDGLESAFQSFAESICNALMNIYIKGLLANAVTGLFGGSGSKVISGDMWGLSSTPSNAISLFAAGGGYISGPGTSTSDSIPAMLSNGEYVINADAVRHIGIGNLNALNGGAGHYAGGGYVGGGYAPNINFVIHNESGQALSAQQDGNLQYDGENWVLNVVLRGYSTNKLGLRDLMRGGR